VPMTEQAAMRSHSKLGDLAYVFGLAALLIGAAALRSWPAVISGAVVAWIVVALATGRRLRTAVGGLAAIVTAVLLKLNPSALPLSYRLIGVGACVVCTWPLIIRPKGKGFPFVGVFCAVQGLYIYVGALIARPSLPYRSVYSTHVRELGLLGSFGYVALVASVGMVARRRIMVRQRLRLWTSRVINVPADSSTYLRALLVFFVGLVVVRMLPGSIASHVGAIPQIVGLGRVAAFALILVLALRGDLSGPKQAIAVLLVVLDVLLGVGTGGQVALYNGAAVAFGALILALVFRPRAALWGIVLIVPVVIVLNAAKIQTRSTLAPTHSRFSATAALFRNTVAIVSNRSAGTLTSAANRFANSDILGYVEVHVPRDYTYWNKRSYSQLPSAVVPRALDPWKPKFLLANEFGRRFGLIAPDDFATSVNTSLQVEAWANFGLLGLVGAGVAMGFLLGAAESLVDATTLDGAAVGTVIALQAIGGIESGATALILVLPVLVALTPVLHWMMLSAAAHRPVRSPVADDTFPAQDYRTRSAL
jgi:hypothetical protein